MSRLTSLLVAIPIACGEDPGDPSPRDDAGAELIDAARDDDSDGPGPADDDISNDGSDDDALVTAPDDDGSNTGDDDSSDDDPGNGVTDDDADDDSGDAGTPGGIDSGADDLDGGEPAQSEVDASSGGVSDGGGAAVDAGEDDPGFESPPGEVPADYTTFHAPGSRLSVATLSAAGAPAVFDDFFDRELGLRCAFVEFGGGLRCVPRAGDVPLEWRGYSDAACTLNLYTVPSCAPAEVFATSTEGDCRELVVTGLVEVTGPQVIHYLDENGECSVLDAAFDPGLPMRVDGASVNPSRFVGGEGRWLATEGQLTLGIVETEDGAYGPLELVDIGIEAACEERFSLDTTECYPRNRAWYEANIFSDDACSELLPVAYASTPWACGDVDYIVAPFTEEGPNLYRPGNAFDEPAWTSVGECTARAAAPWLDHLIELGEPSPIDAGHVLGRYLGDGRLRALAIGERDTSLKIVENTFWDSETGTNCQPMRVDGVTRCVGETGYWLNLGGQYADPECTEFLPYCNTGSCEQTLFFEWGEDESCSGEQSITALRRVVARVTDTVYELDPDTNECVGPVDPFEAWTWEFVDPSEFAELERSIQP